MTVIRPVPGDPDGEFIMNLVPVGADWYLTAPGDYQAMAVEAMANDGSNYQKVIAFSMPVRRNHTTDPEMLNVMIAPEDALGLADTLAHAANVLLRLTADDDHPGT